ncbi:hypothetical protein NIES4071_94530 [Calothrix sp. NIES-4071]|nr:hypothetical protein NIES4071_94530 [Calothrix sp. NIES-4071]BAZ63718.1 hypothetical protein NIES4105_94460 [Calothrix sp. NIES-4105]
MWRRSPQLPALYGFDKLASGTSKSKNPKILLWDGLLARPRFRAPADSKLRAFAGSTFRAGGDARSTRQER